MTLACWVRVDEAVASCLWLRPCHNQPKSTTIFSLQASLHLRSLGASTWDTGPTA